MIRIEYKDKSALVDWNNRINYVSKFLSDSVSNRYVGLKRSEFKKNQLLKYYDTLTDFERATLDAYINSSNKIDDWKTKLADDVEIKIPSILLNEQSHKFLVFLDENNQTNFKRLLEVSPEKLSDLIKEYDIKSGNVLSKDRTIESSDRSNLFSALKQIFVNNGFEKLTNKVEFYKTAHLHVCPYCNHFPITERPKDGEEHPTGEVDHFYCKELYPHLALTLSNLVPSCGGCNGSGSGKWTKDMQSENVVNPHALDHSHGIDFSIDLSGTGSVTDEKQWVNAINIDLKFVISGLDNNDRIFGLKELYNSDDLKKRAKVAFRQGMLYAKKPYREYVDNTIILTGQKISIEDQFYEKMQVSRWDADYSLNPDSCFMMSIFKHTVETASEGKIKIDL